MAKVPPGSVAQLSPGLRVVCEAIREALATATRDEVRGRHRAGELIAQVKRVPNKYGSRAIERIAAALGTNIHTLYRCASVAQCWSRRELEDLLARTTVHGEPLSWSHLVVLAGVVSPRRRAELVDRALRDGLAVRDLIALAGASDTRTSDSGLVALRRVARASERWSQAAAQMHAELLEDLDRVEGRRAAPALIERTIYAQEQLVDIVHRQLARLREERDRSGAKAAQVAE